MSELGMTKKHLKMGIPVAVFYRATNPSDMMTAMDPIGKGNDEVYWGTLLLISKLTLGLLLTFRLYKAAEAWLEREDNRIHVRKGYLLGATAAIIVLYQTPFAMSEPGYIFVILLLPLSTFLIGRGLCTEPPNLDID